MSVSNDDRRALVYNLSKISGGSINIEGEGLTTYKKPTIIYIMPY